MLSDPMQELAAQIEAILMDPSAWLAANLDLVVLAMAAIPVVIIVGFEVAQRLRRGAPERPEAPVVAEPLPEAAPTPEPAAVSEPDSFFRKNRVWHLPHVA